ncbi:MAG: TolC family protein [Deltaproteobacteria bacterium]|nr:TolC family protein [Deltaproteobacteria bacterium]
MKGVGEKVRKIPGNAAGIATAVLLLSLALLPQVSLARAGDEPGREDVLRALVGDALERNSELQAMRSTAEAKTERILPAGSLPDPMLSLAYSNVPTDDFSMSKMDMTSRDIGFTQALPFPGKLSLKEEIARLDAVQTSDRVESLKNLIRFRVKKDFFSLMENREVTRLTEKNKALLGELLSVANSRYEVGKAPQQDIFKAQVEISRMERMLISLRKQKVALLADLNTLRSRPVGTPVELPASYTMPGMPYTERELLEIALASNPDLKREEDGIRRNETALRLARRQVLPDFQIGAAYKFRESSDAGMSRPDFFSANVIISLPLWHGRKQDKEVSAAVKDLSSGKSGYQSTWNAVQNRVRDLTAEISSLGETLSLFDSGLLPQARESVNASLAAYQVGQVEFASVLMGRMALYQQEIDREKTAAALRIRASELELVVAKELFDEGTRR